MENRNKYFVEQLSVFIPECFTFLIALACFILMAYCFPMAYSDLSGIVISGRTGNALDLILFTVGAGISFLLGIALLIMGIVGDKKDAYQFPDRLAKGLSCFFMVGSLIFVAILYFLVKSNS